MNVRTIVAAGVIAVMSGHAVAQLGSAPAPADRYSPPPTASTSPMRVDVLSATSFIDVESRQIYRLYGIDACDLTQRATLGRQTWACGIVAMAWLTTATLNRWVVCTPIREGAGIKIARCATGDVPDLAAEMLKAGHAVNLPGAEDRLIPAYARHEKDARTAYRGLWASAFQMPWIWRQSPREPVRP